MVPVFNPKGPSAFWGFLWCQGRGEENNANKEPLGYALTMVQGKV